MSPLTGCLHPFRDLLSCFCIQAWIGTTTNCCAELLSKCLNGILLLLLLLTFPIIIHAVNKGSDRELRDPFHLPGGGITNFSFHRACRSLRGKCYLQWRLKKMCHFDAKELHSVFDVSVAHGEQMLHIRPPSGHQ
jgi:hypothetical protein